MAVRRGTHNQAQPGVEQRGFYAGLRQRLPGSKPSPYPFAPYSPARYELVRQESAMLGMTTSPFPNYHETVITSSESASELADLRDRITGNREVSEIVDQLPRGWYDTLPGRNKVVAYVIREK